MVFQACERSCIRKRLEYVITHTCFSFCSSLARPLLTLRHACIITPCRNLSLLIHAPVSDIPCQWHYNHVWMSETASQIMGPTIVYSILRSGADQRKHQSSASLAFVRGIHRWPGNSPPQMVSNAESVSNWWRHHGKGSRHFHLILMNVHHDVTKNKSNDIRKKIWKYMKTISRLA